MPYPLIDFMSFVRGAGTPSWMNDQGSGNGAHLLAQVRTANANRAAQERENNATRALQERQDEESKRQWTYERDVEARKDEEAFWIWAYGKVKENPANVTMVKQLAEERGYKTQLDPEYTLPKLADVPGYQLNRNLYDNYPVEKPQTAQYDMKALATVLPPNVGPNVNIYNTPTGAGLDDGRRLNVAGMPSMPGMPLSAPNARAAAPGTLASELRADEVGGMPHITEAQPQLSGTYKTPQPGGPVSGYQYSVLPPPGMTLPVPGAGISMVGQSTGADALLDAKARQPYEIITPHNRHIKQLGLTAARNEAENSLASSFLEKVAQTDPDPDRALVEGMAQNAGNYLTLAGGDGKIALEIMLDEKGRLLGEKIDADLKKQQMTLDAKKKPGGKGASGLSKGMIAETRWLVNTHIREYKTDKLNEMLNEFHGIQSQIDAGADRIALAQQLRALFSSRASDPDRRYLLEQAGITEAIQNKLLGFVSGDFTEEFKKKLSTSVKASMNNLSALRKGAAENVYQRVMTGPAFRNLPDDLRMQQADYAAAVIDKTWSPRYVKAKSATETITNTNNNVDFSDLGAVEQ